MRYIVGALFTPIHLLVFGLILVVFHPLQWVCLKLGGYSWHKWSVDYLNLALVRSLWFLGSHCHFRNPHILPTDRPLIVVSNHQGMHDIPSFFWYLRRHHVKFVSKIELSKGIPSISYNLRHGGSVLIDRENPRQAMPAMKAFAEFIAANNYAACIFPEGTRSKDGVPGAFAASGLKVLLKYMPTAVVVPVTINHAWKLQAKGWFPMPFGVQPTWTVHAPVEPGGKSPEELIAEVERIIKQAIILPKDYQPALQPAN